MLLCTYQSNWVTDFETIRKVIVVVLPKSDTGIEHVGSTAIEGLASKPIIDIDIIYGKNTSFNSIKKGLEGLGYYHNGDQGIIGREVFKRNGIQDKHPILDVIQHHLYVCEIESQELQRHLIFRDFLRRNEKNRKEYEKIKIEIAKRANQDHKVYAELKEIVATEFVESILNSAKEMRE